MQAAAFLALHGTTNNQICRDNQVAQFDQVMTDPEVGIELVDFTLQLTNAVMSAFQAFSGANDADVIPHEAT